MPDEGVLVVGLNDKGNVMVLDKIWANTIYPSLGYLGRRGEFTDHKLFNVTHWTPLPAAPREEA